MEFNRTVNAKRNIAWGAVNKIISMLVSFVMRTIIIYTLGNLYLGLSSLFTSILNALNLAELGVGSAMVFAMYKPVADNDRIKLKALMSLYRYSYLIIGCIVLGLGIAIIPFLPRLITGTIPNGVNLYVVYIIQLLTTSFGYFFMAYKASLFTAFQRTDITSKIQLGSEVAMYFIQIVSLVVFNNFYLYIIAALFRVVIYNLLVGILTDKKYPDLKAEGVVSKEDRKSIFIKTGALLGHKVAAVIINSVDNIFISMYIGLGMVANYNNYYYIITAVSGIFLMLLNGLNSIVGNYLIEESKEKVVKLFYTIHYITSFGICICCTCFLNLYQPFIKLWVGEDALLGMSSVVLFVVCFFSIRIRTIGTLFEDSAGLWEKDVIKSYVMVAIDLVVDIVLLKAIGINGALISTIVTMFFAFFYESVVLHKYCLATKQKRYLISTLIYSVATGASCLVSYYTCVLINFQGIPALVTNLFVSLMLSITMFGLLTCFLKEFSDGIIFMQRIAPMPMRKVLRLIPKSRKFL